MKLELKHLAPYLPYELRCTVSHSKFGTYHQPKIVTSRNLTSALMGGWKPMLVPLSEFNDSAADDEIFERNGRAYTSVSLNDINEFPYWMFEILIKHHYDVFSLIEKGLAINKGLKEFTV